MTVAADQTSTNQTFIDDAHVYDPASIEPRWRQRWNEAAINRVDDDAPGEKWFSLTMYPYT